MPTQEQFVPLRILLPWPKDHFPLPEGDDSFLDEVGLKSFSFDLESSDAGVTFELTLLNQVTFELSFLGCVSLILGDAGQITTIRGTIFWSESFGVGFSEVALTLRFKNSLLKPVELGAEGYVVKVDDAGEVLPVDVTLEGISFAVNSNFEIELELGSNVSFGPAMIADTGIVVEATSFSPILSETAAQKILSGTTLDSSSRGVYLYEAAVHFPEGLSDILLDTLYFEDAFIGSGGFSGSVRLDLSDTVIHYDETKARTIFGFGFTVQKYPSRAAAEYSHPILDHRFLKSSFL